MLRQFSKTIFKNVSWLVKWTPYPYHSGLTAINLLWLLFCLLLPSFFRVQGRERGGSVLKQISDIAQFYSSTSSSCYSITFCLLTLLSLVTEIAHGLCPGDVIKVGSSGSCLVLCMVVGGLVFRGPEEGKLAAVMFMVQLLVECRGVTTASLACKGRWEAWHLLCDVILRKNRSKSKWWFVLFIQLVQKPQPRIIRVFKGRWLDPILFF